MSLVMATILIVEDVPIIREPIAVALRKAGYDVRSAAAACRLVAACRPGPSPAAR